MQPKLHSFIEATVNTVIGFLVSLLIQLGLYPLMGIPVSLTQNIFITGVLRLLRF